MAIASNFVQRRTLFAFKIAYDPEFSALSPGILAEIQTVRFFLESRLEAADSGTTGASYMDDYWQGRARTQHIHVATERWISPAFLLLMPAATAIKRRLLRIRSQAPGAEETES